MNLKCIRVAFVNCFVSYNFYLIFTYYCDCVNSHSHILSCVLKYCTVYLASRHRNDYTGNACTGKLRLQNYSRCTRLLAWPGLPCHSFMAGYQNRFSMYTYINRRVGHADALLLYSVVGVHIHKLPRTLCTTIQYVPTLERKEGRERI